MRFTLLLQLTFVFLLILLNWTPSQAHKIRIFAWEESGIIKAETKFSGGRAAKKAAIKVINEQTKEELLSGTTDSKGFFSFPIPETAKENRYNLEIIVDSGDGHKNSWHLNAADYLQLTEDRPPSPALPATTVIQQNLTNPQESPAYILDEKQLNQIIESALDKKLAPIKRSLAEQQDNKPSLQDILGGIGYILGLAGIAAYFKSQKKQ